MKEINGETAYPIYDFSAKWTQDGDQSLYKDNPQRLDGLPEGRIWNMTSFSTMFKEDKSESWINVHAMNWWDKYSGEKLSGQNPKLLYLKAKFKEHETWVLTWFCHQTFDVGQTDEEALSSFAAFVDRKEQLIREKGEGAYCLMGAEDRWRWRGLGADGNIDNRTDPPCRCKHCKEHGLIRIAH